MSDADNSEHSNLFNQIIAQYLEADRTGQASNRHELLKRYPELANELQAFFADHDKMNELAEPLRPVANTREAETGAEVSNSPGDNDNALADTATLPPADSSDEPKRSAAPAPGTKVRYFGDYELLKEIARGGMGVVYKARQLSLNRTVALKMILAGQLASEEDVQRFYTEAESAANLNHPCIVPIYEVGQHEGQHYFSMGFVEGESLADKLAAGLLPPREAAEHGPLAAGVSHLKGKPISLRFHQERCKLFSFRFRPD